MINYELSLLRTAVIQMTELHKKVKNAPSWPRSVGPTSAFYTYVCAGMRGPACIFWANLTPFLLKGADMKQRSTKGISTAAIDYMMGCATGQAALGVVICMSTASQNGWETWFSCQCECHSPGRVRH